MLPNVVKRSKDSCRAKPRKNLELDSIRRCGARSEPALWTFIGPRLAVGRIYGARMRAKREDGR